MRFWKCVRKAVPVAMKTSMWFLKIMLPVSLFVTLLSYFNILPYISSFAAPLFTLIGLPGDAALVFVETLVLQKTGSSARGMIFLRVAGSFVAAIVLNWILPEMGGQMMAETAVAMNLGDTLIHWLESSLMLCVKIVLMITGLMILQRVLEEFGVLKILSSMLSPLMRVFGLKPDVAFLWLVGNTVGLAYGSAIMLEYAKEGKLAHQEADLLNYHLAISHSQLEDPLLFVVMGLPIGWLIFPRVVLAIIVVWIRRGIYGLRAHAHPVVKVENVSI